MPHGPPASAPGSDNSEQAGYRRPQSLAKLELHPTQKARCRRDLLTNPRQASLSNPPMQIAAAQLPACASPKIQPVPSYSLHYTVAEGLELCKRSCQKERRTTTTHLISLFETWAQLPASFAHAANGGFDGPLRSISWRRSKTALVRPCLSPSTYPANMLHSIRQQLRAHSSKRQGTMWETADNASEATENFVQSAAGSRYPITSCHRVR